MSAVAFVIASRNFQETEFQVPREILQKAGFTCPVAALERGICVGGLGQKVLATRVLAELKPANFAGVVFVGGGGSAIFDHNPVAHQVVREFFAAQKVCAAICHAPVIFAYAGILRGKQATCFATAENEEVLRAKGAILSGRANEVDGKVITANGPPAAAQFGKQIVSVLKEGEEREKN